MEGRCNQINPRRTSQLNLSGLNRQSPTRLIFEMSETLRNCQRGWSFWEALSVQRRGLDYTGNMEITQDKTFGGKGELN